jgi:hypothetical protein
MYPAELGWLTYPVQGVTMKKTLLLATALTLAACGGGKKAEAPAADTAAMAPAAGAADTGMAGMSHDSMAKSDTTMARDTTKAKK